MNISLILTLVVLAFLAFRILWGFVRSLKGQRIRTIMILACAIVALVATFSLRNTLLTDSVFQNSVEPLLGDVTSGTLSQFDTGSVIISILAGVSASLIAPLFCLVVFLILSIITWIVYAILFLFLHKKFRQSDRKKTNEKQSVTEENSESVPYDSQTAEDSSRSLEMQNDQPSESTESAKPETEALSPENPEQTEVCRKTKGSVKHGSAKWLRLIGLSVAEAVIVIGIWLIPVIYYSDLTVEVIDTVQLDNLIEDKEVTEQLAEFSVKYVSPIYDHPFVVISRICGGEAISNRMSVVSFTANGKTVKTNLKGELKSSLALAGKVMKLKDFNMNSLSSKEVDALKGIADSFADSKLLSTIVCDFLQSATDAWSKGNEFAGVEWPNLGGGEGDVAEMMDSLFDIISNDTKSVDLLKKDLYTVADFMNVIIKYGAMDAFSGGDVSSLASIIGTTIDGDDILTAMNKVLAANDSFAPIYEKLNSIVDSVKAQAFEQIFGITGEEAEALTAKTEEIFGDVADTINAIDKSQPIETQKEELSSALEDIIRANAAEVNVTIEGVDIGAVSDSVAAEFLENPDKYENVSQEDVKAYILQYASGQIQ